MKYDYSKIDKMINDLEDIKKELIEHGGLTLNDPEEQQINGVSLKHFRIAKNWGDIIYHHIESCICILEMTRKHMLGQESDEE